MTRALALSAPFLGFWPHPRTPQTYRAGIRGTVQDSGGPGTTVTIADESTAYHSNETDRDEIYVRTFPDGNRRWPISTSGGAYRQRNPRGGEILYGRQRGHGRPSASRLGSPYRVGASGSREDEPGVPHRVCRRALRRTTPGPRECGIGRAGYGAQPRPRLVRGAPPAVPVNPASGRLFAGEEPTPLEHDLRA